MLTPASNRGIKPICTCRNFGPVEWYTPPRISPVIWEIPPEGVPTKSASRVVSKPTREPVLCSCCVKHGGFAEDNEKRSDRNVILDIVVPCVECGEYCSCDGCVADFQEGAVKSGV